jgi:hypothetical protein
VNFAFSLERLELMGLELEGGFNLVDGVECWLGEEVGDGL